MGKSKKDTNLHATKKHTSQSLVKPPGVPESARWNEKDKEWELGEIKDKKRIGAFTWWRPNGTLVCQSHFNASGQLHGEFTRYHPDGTVSRTGTFLHGNQAGIEIYTRSKHKTEESFPGNPPLWRVEIDHGEQGHSRYGDPQSSRYFLKDGTEVNQNGIPLQQAYQDTIFTSADPSTFLENGGFEKYLTFSRELKTTKKRAKKAPLQAILPKGFSDFQAVWGMEIPADLNVCIQLLCSFQDAPLFEWNPDFADSFPMLPTAEEENMVEKMIKDYQTRYFTMAPCDIFSGSLLLGYLGNGDFYQYGLYDQTSETEDPSSIRQVWFFDHEEDNFDSDGPITQDLSTLTYLSSLCAAYENEGMLSLEGLKAGFTQLKGHTLLSWHFRHLQEKAGFDQAKDFDYQSKIQVTPDLYACSLWIQCLLQNQLDEVQDAFYAELNSLITSEDYQEILKNIPLYVPTAMYYLFRFFFFNEKGRLQECIAVCKKSASRLIRDAAKLVEELQNGRKQLGKIKNIHTLRKKFLTFDLDPQREQERQKEQKKKSIVAQTAKNNAVSLVKTWVEQGSDIEDLAWQYLDDKDIHDEIMKHLRTRLEMQKTFEIFDWIEAKGYVHDNLVLEEELIEACECLSELGDKRLLPLLVGKLYQGGPEAYHSSRILLKWTNPQVAEAVFPLLHKENHYHVDQTRAVQILTAVGFPKAAPIIAHFLTHYRLDKDFSESMMHVTFLGVCLAFFKKWPDPAASQALQFILFQKHNRYICLRGIAAVALAKLQEVSILPKLLKQKIWVSTNEDADLIWALGELGKQAQPKEKKQICKFLQNISPQIEMHYGIAQAALQKLGVETKDLQNSIQRMLSMPKHGRDDTIHQRTWALRIIEESKDLPISLAYPHLYSESPMIRKQALSAVKARGAKIPPIHKYYRFVLDDLYTQGGLEALHQALLDEQGLFRYNIAFKLADLQDPRSAEPLCIQIQKHLQHWESWTADKEGPSEFDWLVRALIRLGPLQEISVKIILTCLTHENKNVKDPILREKLPSDERLIPGMLQVVEENYGWQAKVAKQWLKPYLKTEAYKKAVAQRRV